MKFAKICSCRKHTRHKGKKDVVIPLNSIIPNKNGVAEK